MEFGRVTGHHMHIPHIHPQLLSDDLGKGGKVSLSLGANTGGDADLAAGLDGDPRPFIGSHTGGLDKGDDADAHMSCLRRAVAVAPP